MTKRIITVLLMFAMVFVLASCGGPKNSSPPTIKEIDFTKITKIDKIELTYSSQIRPLTDEQMEYVISLWREGEWKPSQWKISPDYVFKAGDLLLKYDLSNGIFVDSTNDRHLIISDEQIEVLKSYLTTVSADAIAEITVGMTYSQVCQILMVPGMGAVEGSSSSGAVIYQFNCDDGSKFLISFLLDTEQKVPVVTNITKVDTEA